MEKFWRRSKTHDAVITNQDPKLMNMALKYTDKPRSQTLETIDDDGNHKCHLNIIREKIKHYMYGIKTEMENFPTDSKMSQDYDKTLAKVYPKVFNEFFIEIIKMIREMLEFGVYQIQFNVAKLKKNKQRKRQNSEIKHILKTLFTILEYDKTYPEARIILKQNQINIKRLNEQQSA